MNGLLLSQSVNNFHFYKTGDVMRRKDKEINEIAAIEEILRQAAICRLALCAKD